MDQFCICPVAIIVCIIFDFIHEQNQIFLDTGNINADMFCIAIAV